MDTVHSQLATDPFRLGEIDPSGKTASGGVRRRETPEDAVPKIIEVV